MHDHVTLLSPARIERGIARENFTPILSRTRSSGFNVFGLRMGLRSAGLKASEHFGSDARAAGCQSRSGVPYRHPPNLPGSTSFVLRFRSPAHLHFGQASANFLRPDVLLTSEERVIHPEPYPQRRTRGGARAARHQPRSLAATMAAIPRCRRSAHDSRHPVPHRSTQVDARILPMSFALLQMINRQLGHLVTPKSAGKQDAE
jgi:hypothetical protein